MAAKRTKRKRASRTRHDLDCSRLRRLRPSTQLPARPALRQLDAEDRELIARCISATHECLYHDSFRNAPYRRLTPATAVAHEAGDEPTNGTLSREQEQSLFLRFNYCRYQVMRILRVNAHRRLPLADARDLVSWQRAADQLRSVLIDFNVALVHAMVQRFGHRNVEQTELVSEGNLTLVRCVDKFDATRGFKFSTYACRAILANFARTTARHARARAQAPVSYAPEFDRSDHLERKREDAEQDTLEELQEIIAGNAAQLTTTEQRVLNARFGLQPRNVRRIKCDGSALHHIGTALGVSKERVRQIQCRALGKLRAVLDERLVKAG